MHGDEVANDEEARPLMIPGSSPTDRAPRGMDRSWRMALLVGLAAIGAALLAGSAQARTPKVFFGIDQGGFVTEADYQQMHKIKLRTVRLTINWSKVEPAPGVFHWDGVNAGNVDGKVAALARNGITPAFSVYGAPKWATGSGNAAVPPVEGGALQDWKTFLQKAVQRYKEGGGYWQARPELTPRPAKSWQIWNEPNLPKYFAKPGSNPVRSYPQAPKAYGKLVKASDQAIHAADPHAKLVLAGMTGQPKGGSQTAASFVTKVLRVRGVKRHFDVAALHPYGPRIKDYKSRISQFRTALNKHGAKKKPIWLTEVGWGSANNRQPLNKGMRGQASMLQKSFKLTLENRKKWKIGRLYWFDWRDPEPGTRALCTFCPSAGLLKHDGSHKPSYDRFKRFSRAQGRRSRHHHHHHHHHRRR
jgi:hypothetical protein